MRESNRSLSFRFHSIQRAVLSNLNNEVIGLMKDNQLSALGEFKIEVSGSI